MLPLIKVLILAFKILSRPLNNILKRVFTHRLQFMHRFIGLCGQQAHKFEIHLNRKIVNQTQKLDFYIKPLSEEAAFNKGVEYFVEVVFFYGVLIGIAVWEVKKSQDASDKLKQELKELHINSKESQELARMLKLEVEDLAKQKSQSE